MTSAPSKIDGIVSLILVCVFFFFKELNIKY